MRDGFAPVRLIDHGREDHKAVETDLFAIPGEASGDQGRVFGDAGKHGNAPFDDRVELAENQKLLFVFVGGVFADAAEEDDAVDAGGDHFFEVGGGGFEVNRKVVAVLSCQRRIDAVPVHFHGFFLEPLRMIFCIELERAAVG